MRQGDRNFIFSNSIRVKYESVISQIFSLIFLPIINS